MVAVNKKSSFVDNLGMLGCVKCGYCCRKGPCWFGSKDPETALCAFFDEDNNLCKKYDEIKKSEEGDPYPFFDDYCSGAFLNTVRGDKVKELIDKGTTFSPVIMLKNLKIIKDCL